MTRQQIHMEKDKCMLAHITHQTGREHPQSPQTNMHGLESYARHNRALEPCLLRNAVTFHTARPVVRPD